MRNVVISDDAAAQQAGAQVLTSGGNAVDAAVAALLAGAARASASSLLGSALVLVAGPGVGAQVVDGRARAPGLGERRVAAPADPPVAWRAAVPGLLAGALATLARFGSQPLGAVTRAASAATRATDAGNDAVLARLALIEALPRYGMDAMARLGVHQAMLELAGPAAGGVIGRDDLLPVLAPVQPLVETRAGEHQLLTAPIDPVPRFAPPPVPAVPVRGVLCGDMHGVMACALWAVAPDALTLAGTPSLSLAALSNAPTHGVTRRRPGSTLPLVVPAMMVRHEGRVWGAFAAAGTGDVEGAVRAFVETRLATAGVVLPERIEARGAMTGTLLHVVRDAGGDVRGGAEGFAA